MTQRGSSINFLSSCLALGTKWESWEVTAHTSSKLIRHFPALIPFLCFSHWTNTCINQAVVHYPLLETTKPLVSSSLSIKDMERNISRIYGWSLCRWSQSEFVSFSLAYVQVTNRSSSAHNVSPYFYKCSIPQNCCKMLVQCYIAPYQTSLTCSYTYQSHTSVVHSILPT